MKIASAVWCAVALMAGCTPATEEEPFADKGAGSWVEMKGVPELSYRAVWGANAREMYAVGDGGVAVGDGDAWRLLDEVPPASYRAIWGRSPSEVWIGGDGILLARTLTGWQQQMLFDGSLEVTEYSVVALGGGALDEYAIVLTGGELLLFGNQGSAWETVWWRDAAGPGWPLPRDPSLFARGSDILVGGAGDTVRCSLVSEYGISRWEAYRWPYGGDLPRLASVTGGDGFWVGAGGAWAVVLDDGEEEPTIIPTEGDAARAIHARSANELFVVGDTIEACDRSGCAVEAGVAAKGLRAAWGDGDATVVAAGDGVILERETGR